MPYHDPYKPLPDGTRYCRFCSIPEDNVWIYWPCPTMLGIEDQHG